MSSPQLSSRRISLRPMAFERREDLRAVLEEAGLEGADGAESFFCSLPGAFTDVDATFMVDDDSNGSPIGTCVVFGIDREQRSAQISILIDGASAPLGAGLETYVFFIGHVFSEWDIDRVQFWARADQVKTIPVSWAVISETKSSVEGQGSSSADHAKAFTIEREVWELQGDRFRSWIMRGSGKN